MTDYYLDPINGNDGNDGTTFANRKKTLEAFSGIAVATDTIRICATHDPIATIQGGNLVLPDGGYQRISPPGSIGCRQLWFGNSTVSWTFTAYNGGTAFTSTSSGNKPGISGVSIDNINTFSNNFFSSPQTVNTKVYVIDLLAQQDLSGYDRFVTWLGFGGDTTLMLQTTPDTIDVDCLRVKLCSDALGDVVLEDWPVTFSAPAFNSGIWMTFNGTGAGGALPSNVRSIAFYTGATNYPVASGYVHLMAGYALEPSCVVAPGCLISPKIPGRNRAYWSEVGHIKNGTSLSPHIYPCSENTAFDAMAEGGPYEWESLKPIHWTKLSDFDYGDNWKLNGWNIDNMAASFDNVTLIGGHSPVDGSPGYGYTVLDFGIFNPSLGYWMYCSPPRTLAFRKFISIGGEDGGSFIHQGTTASHGYKIDWEDCHVFGTGINTGYSKPGGVTGSIVKNCSFNHTSIPIDVAYGGNFTFENVVLTRVLSGDFSAEDSTLIIKNCEFLSGTGSFVVRTNAPYGGDIDFQGTNTFVNVNLSASAPGAYASKVVTGLVLKGGDFSWVYGTNTVIDGLYMVGGTGTVYNNCQINAESGPSTLYPTFGAGATGFTIRNSTIDAIDALTGYGITFENSTIYTVWGTNTTNNTSKTGFTFRNCYVGGKTDVINSNWRVYSQPLIFYNCTINRMKFISYVSSSVVKVVGGSMIGSSWQHFGTTGMGSSNMPPQKWLFHNVNFPQYDLEAQMVNAFSEDSGLFYYADYEDSGIVFSGYNNNPTNCLIVNPWWRMKSSTAVVRTAGGRSWLVEFSRKSAGDQPRHNFARVAVRNGIQLTAKIWVYTVTSGCYAFFGAEAGQVGTTQGELATQSTSIVGEWEQLTLTFTPNADGVMEFHVSFSAPNNTHSLYLDDSSFEQS